MRCRYLAVALVVTAPAFAYDLEWHVDGYYRARASYIRNLANQPENTVFLGESERLRRTKFLLHRARLEPRLQLEKIAKFQLTIDALDDVVWGDNSAKQVAPLFAVNPSDVNVNGENVASVQVKRAWLEFNVPIGQVRVGRLPSQWGMGLLANGGGSSGCEWAAADADAAKFQCLDGYFDDDFGDNHFGSINDRILFATRPIQVYKTLAGHKDPTSNFIAAYMYNKLVEDYLNVPLEQQLVGQTLDNATIKAVPTDPLTQRPYGESAFLSRPNDDVQEHVVVLLYNNPDFDKFRLTDELRGGLYMVFRNQPESRIVCQSQVSTDSDGNKIYQTPACGLDGPGDLAFVGEGSNVQIYDLWYRLRLGWFYGESEFFTIRGNTDGGVPIGTQVTLQKDAEIYGLASRWGYESRKLDGLFEFGFSSGDDNIADDTFTQRPNHPDYNVGLLMYEEIIRELTARTIGRLIGLGGYIYNSRSLQSNGGVINSWYVNPRVRYRPLDFVELIGGFLAAWWDKTGFLPTQVLQPKPGSPFATRDPEKFIGWELDGAVKVTWADAFLTFSLEGAYMHFGQGLFDAYQFQGAPPVVSGVKGATTIQSRLAFVF